MVDFVNASVSSTTAACGLRMLTTHTDAPVMTETTMQPHFLHPLDVLSETLIQEIRILLRCFAILDITLTIQHICRNLELERVPDHGNNLVNSSVVNSPARLFMSMSHFLQMILENRRPMPLIAVSANITFWRPSTFVLQIRKICWKFWVCIWTDMAPKRILRFYAQTYLE